MLQIFIVFHCIIVRPDLMTDLNTELQETFQHLNVITVILNLMNATVFCPELKLILFNYLVNDNLDPNQIKLNYL